MLKKAAAFGLAFAMMAAPMFANEGDVHKGVLHLDHVFVIMMENHAYGQIVGNPSAPFANKYMQSANAGPVCDFDPASNGTQVGLNPALIYQCDLALRNLVKAIHASPAWKDGRNAIVVLWDENDYSGTPNVNQVLLIVDTNYGVHGVQSAKRYTHFSLLKTIEGGFGLPCLNHACDNNVKVMSDLFAGDHDHDHDGL